MVTINNKCYKNYKTYIKWGYFSAVVNGKKEEGLAPIIKFNVDNIIIELEFVLSKEKFQKLEIDKKFDCSRYLVGVAYVDDKGWIPIINDSVKIYITRINEKKFKIDFEIKCIELEDVININISSYLKIL